MNDFISYLNSTNNIGGNSTGSLAEAQVKSPFYDSVKVARRVGTTISEEVKTGNYRSYILTGHAGDGKTSILVQVLKSLGLLGVGEGLEIEKEYEHFFYVKDMSEIPEQKQVELLRRTLSAPQRGKTGLLISNTGPLLKSFTTLSKDKKNEEGLPFEAEDRIELQSTILTQLDRNEDIEITVAGYNFVLVNIARVDNVSFATKILSRIIDPELWKACESCTVADKCPMCSNRNLLVQNYERVSTFIDNYYRYLFENDKRMTIRQMVGQISYGITGNLTCEKVLDSMLKEPQFTFNFANLFFGYRGLGIDKNSTQIKGIQHIQTLGLDGIALDVDYRLFVNHDYSFFPADIRTIIEELSQKSRKHFQVVEETAEAFSNQQARTARIRKAVRRFYLVFGVGTQDYPVEAIFNQIYGSNYVDYKKMITSVQPSSMTRKFQNVVFNALYIKNTGFLPASSSENLLPLTLRREDEVYQSVLLVLGEVNKSDIKIITEKIVNQLEDADEKYEIYIQLKDEKFKISLPMIKYFNDLIDGAVTSNNNPALTHGIASLDTLLLEQYGDDNPEPGEDCEISVIVNTTHGQKIKRFDFNGNRMHLVD